MTDNLIRIFDARNRAPDPQLARCACEACHCRVLTPLRWCVACERGLHDRGQDRIALFPMPGISPQ